MANHRALLLGVTGTRKSSVLDRLQEYRDRTPYRGEFNDYHLQDYITRGLVDMWDYISMSEYHQRKYWIDGWRRFTDDILSDGLSDRTDHFLCMHGVLTRQEYGVRSPVVIEKVIQEYEPTVIITLIDDIHSIRHRIYEKAAGDAYKGQPTLEQISYARRSSIFFGSLLAKQYEELADPIPHYVLSIWHPARTLDRIMSNQSDLTTAYMAHSISTPRKYLDHGQPELKSEFNEIFNEVTNFVRDRESFTLFSPLTIDEYPLIFALDDAERIVRERDNDEDTKEEYIKFDTGRRWDVRDFYDDDTTLLIEGIEPPEEMLIPVNEIQGVKSLIKNDVEYRDKQLVSQSDCLAVYNPILKSFDKDKYTISKGVNAEIRYTLQNKGGRVPVRIYQDAEHDPDGIIHNHFSKHGAVGDEPGSEWIKITDDIQEHFQQLPV